ncbi:translation elongation factor EF1B/ribosomal protein S6 family protein [Actinidia rufa]|uniref:Translation elongation factor EF1B/ribosomal protein S6 family protein n=1 Tax=Actinidia rufa TaxID=165716 RepID=A0A7J0F6L3_9ERIC|nr:translation elongation factor EF1B/ribosomal protein S6 family protein [Actinidia rufa]
MAVTFSDLHTESGLKSLDEFLSGKTYVSGDQLTKDDIKVYAAVLEKPNGDLFPNTSQWYHCVSSKLTASFPGKAVGVRIAGQAAPVEAAPAKVEEEFACLIVHAYMVCQLASASATCYGLQPGGKPIQYPPCKAMKFLTLWLRWGSGDSFGHSIGIFVGIGVTYARPNLLPVSALAGDDDDDLDLFGDETEEEKKAAEQREAAKAPAKKKESGKSSVLLDVKPWDDETDMKKLEESVRSIEMPGLLWGASKLVPVGYGIKKLQIMMTIVDDLVSVDTLIEERLTVEPINEYVQSCDIAAFNKI